MGTMATSAVLITPSILSTRSFQGSPRTTTDSTKLSFEVVNNVVPACIKMTNVRILLDFDYTNANLTLNGVAASPTGGLPLKPFPDLPDTEQVLLPQTPVTISVDLVANATGASTPTGQYAIAVRVTFELELVGADPTAPLGLGNELFTVVAD